MKYYVYPESRDGCAFPTTPEPMELEQTGAHITQVLKRYEHQGYFSNCRQEHISLDELSFRVVPDIDENWACNAII